MNTELISFFSYFVVMAGLATTGCSSSLEEDSLSELPAAKNLDSVAIFLSPITKESKWRTTCRVSEPTRD